MAKKKENEKKEAEAKKESVTIYLQDYDGRCQDDNYV